MTASGTNTAAAGQWRAALGEWAIPPEILAAAPEPPWAFSPAMFARRAEQVVVDIADTPSRRRAVEALPEGGSVLDVGVGGGAACLPLVPPAALLVGVDDGDGMLAAFAAGADRLGVAHREIQGTWPAVASEVDAADVVVSHHVLYNIADLVPFAAALTSHARHRVVVEISADHPTANLSPLWLAIHGIVRPTSPTADDAIAVFRDMGLDVSHEEATAQWQHLGADRADMVAMMRRRLCVGPERDAEIDAALGTAIEAPLRRNVTIWWEGTA